PGFLAAKPVRALDRAPARAARLAESFAERCEQPGHGVGDRLGLRQDARDLVLYRLSLLRALALGDVDDRADQPTDLPLAAPEGRLVVQRMAEGPVVDRRPGL